MTAVAASKVECPACAGTVLRHMGTLPYRPGLIVLDTPGDLYRCDCCGLHFRHPYPSEAAIAARYGEFPASTWDNFRRRPDFELAADIITSAYTTGRVLDVGCFRGDFLADYLPARFEKFGVEPSRAGRSVAESRGVSILGGALQEIPANGARFDAICLFDCIEHIRNPYAALSRASGLLAAGGRLLISTGDADFPLWNAMETDYYYYYNEHVSFLTREWLKWAAAKLQLTIESVQNFARDEAPLRIQAKHVIACCLRLAQRHVGRSRFRKWAQSYPLSLCSRVQGFGVPGLADHVLCVLRAPAHSTVR